MALQISQRKNVAPVEKKGNIPINFSWASNINGSVETSIPFRERGKRANIFKLSLSCSGETAACKVWREWTKQYFPGVSQLPCPWGRLVGATWALPTWGVWDTSQCTWLLLLGSNTRGQNRAPRAANFGIAIRVLQKEQQPPAPLIPLVDLSRRSMLLKTRQVLAISFQSLPTRLRVETLTQMCICEVFQMLHLKPVSTGSLPGIGGALQDLAQLKGALAAGLSLSLCGSCGDKHPVELFQGYFSTSVSTRQINLFLSLPPPCKWFYGHQKVYTWGAALPPAPRCSTSAPQHGSNIPLLVSSMSKTDKLAEKI